MARIQKDHRAKLNINPMFIFRIAEASGADHAVPGNRIAGQDGHFPLYTNPVSIQMRKPVRVHIMNTSEYGVADEHGPGIPSWEMSGQFTVTPVKGLSNWGMQRAFEEFIEYYVVTNKARGAKRKRLLILEFYDFYQEEYWRVVPMNIPQGSRSVDAPTIERYSLSWRGLRPIAKPANLESVAQNGILESPTTALRDTCPFWTGSSCTIQGCQHVTGSLL